MCIGVKLEFISFFQFVTSSWNKLYLPIPEWATIYYFTKSFYVLLALIDEHGKREVESFTVKLTVLKKIFKQLGEKSRKF